MFSSQHKKQIKSKTPKINKRQNIAQSDNFKTHSDLVANNREKTYFNENNLNRWGSYDLSSADDGIESNEVERELLKY